MPYNENSDGPWGRGKKKETKAGSTKSPWGGENSGDKPKNSGPDQGIPEIDQIVRKGQERLRKIMGGGSGSGGGANGPNFGDGFGRNTISLALVGLFVAWAFLSFYSVKPEEKSIELFFGEYYDTGESGLNFAPWPFITHEVVTVTRENTEDIGVGGRGGRIDEGLMLTGDENIVDIDFQVVWNISDLSKFLFNLADPVVTIRAVAESAMREVIGRSDLSPILNRDRALISGDVSTLIQEILDSYNSGVNIVRLNFDKADPPAEVIDSFRDVQAAEQERDTLEKKADAYEYQALARARGEAEQLKQEAEGYKAQVVNEATGEASRFISIYDEYVQARDVTRKRLYLDSMEKVLGDVDKVILDQNNSSGQGVVPYLPLNQLKIGSNN
jgi:membrane protease subunit HflK